MFLIKNLKKKLSREKTTRRTSIVELFNLKGFLILPMFRHERWIYGQLVKWNHLATGPHTWVTSQLLPYLLTARLMCCSVAGGDRWTWAGTLWNWQSQQLIGCHFYSCWMFEFGKGKPTRDFKTRLIPVLQCLNRGVTGSDKVCEILQLVHTLLHVNFLRWKIRRKAFFFFLFLNLWEEKCVWYFLSRFRSGQNLFDLEFHCNFNHSLWHLVPIYKVQNKESLKSMRKQMWNLC